MWNAKDLTGEVFGKLKVLKRLPNYKNKKTFYECKCECGNIHIIYGYKLTSGKTISCPDCSRMESGKKRRIDRIGEKYNKLTILEMLYDYNGTGITHVKCQCECGNVKIIAMNNVISNNIKSCG